MKSLRNLWWLGVVAAVAACDPYEDERGGTPTVLGVFGSGGDENGAAAVVDGAKAGDSWTVPVPSTCEPEHLVARGVVPRGTTVEAATVSDTPVVTVKANKLLDGASIQADPLHCDPALRGGNPWITVTRTVGAGTPEPDTADWFTCYSPGTASEAEGASIIIYRGADITTGPGGEGYFSLSELAGDAGEIATYAITGSVLDRQGNELKIDVNVEVEPDAGPVKSIRATSVTGTGDAVAATFEFTPAGCLSATSYQAQRDTNEDPKAGPNWTNVDAAIPAIPGDPGPLTFSDSGLTYGKTYSYRIRGTVVVGTEEFTETVGEHTFTAFPIPTEAPTATLTAASGTGTDAKPDRIVVDSTATAPTGAAGLAILRAAEDESIVAEDLPGAFSVIKENVAAFPIEDTGLAAAGCQQYFYAVAPVDADGNVGQAGPASSGVKTPVAKVAAPTFDATKVTSTTVEVKWSLVRGAVTYSVERALDEAGTPGTWASIATVSQPANPAPPAKAITSTTYDDSGLAANTKYHYRVNVTASDPGLCAVGGFATSTGKEASVTTKQ